MLVLFENVCVVPLMSEKLRNPQNCCVPTRICIEITNLLRDTLRPPLLVVILSLQKKNWTHLLMFMFLFFRDVYPSVLWLAILLVKKCAKNKSAKSKIENEMLRRSLGHVNVGGKRQAKIHVTVKEIIYEQMDTSVI